MKIAHLFQGSGIRFSESSPAQLHIYHTIRGLQAAGHLATLLALQDKRRVLYTNDLKVFKGITLLDDDFGKLGLSGTRPLKLFESGLRRAQVELNLPYIGLFDSYRMYDACCQNLQSYDLIHERYNLLALGGALASRKLGLPYFLEVNADLIAQRKFKGRSETGMRRLFAIWATRFCFNRAAKIICISGGLRDHLHRNWKVALDKLVVLPCAADTEAFGRSHDTQRVRYQLGLSNEPVVMWVGGFYDWHDLDLLLESFTKVLRSLPQAKLVLVGDGETRPVVERTVMENGLRQAVIMTGAIAHAKVPELLSIADVTVVPAAPASASQGGTGTPLKIFEYMAAAKAIVTTNIAQNAAVIRDGHNGLLVEPGNVDGFANAIVALLNDPSERDRLVQNARREAVEQHSWEHYTKRLEEIYLSVL